MTDGQVESWRFVAVQPPNTLPRVRRKPRELFDFFRCYLGRDGDGGGSGHRCISERGLCGSFRRSESRGHPFSSTRMDKDNRDDFTFAKLSDLKVPVTLRMSAVSAGSVAPNRAQGLGIVHSSRVPGFLVRSPNFWRNRS